MSAHFPATASASFEQLMNVICPEMPTEPREAKPAEHPCEDCGAEYDHTCSCNARLCAEHARQCECGAWRCEFCLFRFEDLELCRACRDAAKSKAQGFADVKEAARLLSSAKEALLAQGYNTALLTLAWLDVDRWIREVGE